MYGLVHLDYGKRMQRLASSIPDCKCLTMDVFGIELHMLLERQHGKDIAVMESTRLGWRDSCLGASSSGDINRAIDARIYVRYWWNPTL